MNKLSFLTVAKNLINELKEYEGEYSDKNYKQVLELEALAKNDFPCAVMGECVFIGLNLKKKNVDTA